MANNKQISKNKQSPKIKNKAKQVSKTTLVFGYIYAGFIILCAAVGGYTIFGGLFDDESTLVASPVLNADLGELLIMLVFGILAVMAIYCLFGLIYAILNIVKAKKYDDKHFSSKLKKIDIGTSSIILVSVAIIIAAVSLTDLSSSFTKILEIVAFASLGVAFVMTIISLVFGTIDYKRAKKVEFKPNTIVKIKSNKK